MASPTSKILIRSNGSIEASHLTPPPDSSRQYYRILQDDELDDYTRPSDGELRGKPGVMRLEEHHYTHLTEAYQWMWYRLNNPTGFTEQKWQHAWLAYTESSRAYCNSGGIYDQDNDKYLARDYINNKGIGLKLPKIATLVTINNVLCGEEVLLTERQGELRAGTWALKVETIRAPMQGLSYKTHPHLVHKAVTIVETPASETDPLRRVNPFTDFDGRYSGVDVYIPVISSKQVYYPLRRLKKLPIGSPLPPVWRPA